MEVGMEVDQHSHQNDQPAARNLVVSTTLFIGNSASTTIQNAPSVPVFDTEHLTYTYPYNPHSLSPHPNMIRMIPFPAFPSHLLIEPSSRTVPIVAPILTFALAHGHPLRSSIWAQVMYPQIHLLIVQYLGIEYANKQVLLAAPVSRRQLVFHPRDTSLEVMNRPPYVQPPRYRNSPTTIRGHRDDTTVLFVVRGDKTSDFDGNKRMEERAAWDRVRQETFALVQTWQGKRVRKQGGSVWVETVMWDGEESGNFQWDK